MAKHELPKLSYAFNALEPFIDTQTMEIHYSKHHATYVAKLNEILENYKELQDKTVEELLKSLNYIPESIRNGVRNFGGGHYNHLFFWEILAPVSNDVILPTGELVEAINNNFGSFETFKKQFTVSAITFFGSGWTWLVADKNQKLLVINTVNQESPIILGLKPLLTLDLWEHAYYLKYQNRRPEYVEAWWNVVNWKKVEENLNK
ncbi:MAG: superoxide dismutase [Patescibacteria group bacterium]|nr:superoxide dismutase [Patescibacteria group bacterium]